MGEVEDGSAGGAEPTGAEDEAFLDWLRRAGLAKFRDVLVANDVNLQNASLLTDGDLVGLGLTVGARRSFLEAAAEFGRAQHGALQFGQERRQLTVLFADLVDWTERSLQLDPELLRSQVDAFRQLVRQVADRHGGNVAQTLGDGVLCYFGWPRAHENDADRAIHAALGLTAGVGGLPVVPPLRLRIGIATGLVSVGGDRPGDSSLAVGEAPNLAARLLTLAEPGQVVIGPMTRKLVGGGFNLAELGPHPLKGIPHPVVAYRVEGVDRTKGRFAARAAATGVSKLLGRDAELRHVLDCWRKAAAGDGQVVLLSGEAGIGKSRLLYAFENTVGSGRPLLHFDASPIHSTTALYPLIEHLIAASGIRPDDDVTTRLDKLRAEVARAGQADEAAFQVIAGLLSISTGEELNLSADRYKEVLLGTLSEYLHASARQSGSILIFEDLHWIDPTTEELLGLLIERCRDAPLLLLATFRPEYRPKWQGANIDVLALGRFAPSLTAQLVQQVAGPDPLDAALTAEIVTRADGVPLFAEEITRAVLAGRGGTVPATLQDSLLARLDPLANAKGMVQLGACIGNTFDADLLAAISDAADPAANLAEAVGAQILFLAPGSVDSTYGFHHSLLRDAAYEALPVARRSVVHGKIASALEQRFPDRAANSPELVAYHFALAGVVDKAVDYWLRAGQRSIARFENEEAAAHFQRGLELIAGLPQGTARDTRELLLQHGLGTAIGSRRGYTPPEVGAAFGRALELSASVGDFPERHAVTFGLWLYYLMRAEYSKSSPLAEQFASMALQTADRDTHVGAYNVSAVDDFFIGKLRSSLAKSEIAWTIYQELGEPPLHNRYGMNAGPLAMDFDGYESQVLGYSDRAAASHNKAIAAALRTKDPVTIATVLSHAPVAASFRRDWTATLAFSKQCIDYSKENKIFIRQVEGDFWNGLAVAELGNLCDGLEIVQKAIVDWNGIGARITNCLYYTVLSQLLAKAGRPADAWSAIQRGIEYGESCGELMTLPEARRVEGDLYRFANNDPGRAALAYQRAIQEAHQMDAKWWELRAAVSYGSLLHSQGRSVEALDIVAPVYGWFTEGFSFPDLIEAKDLIEQLRLGAAEAADGL